MLAWPLSATQTTDTNMASCSTIDYRCSPGLQWEQGPWKSTQPQVTDQTTDIHMNLGLQHGLGHRLWIPTQPAGAAWTIEVFQEVQSRNEPFFISDILLLLRTSVMMWLGTVFWPCSARIWHLPHASSSVSLHLPLTTPFLHLSHLSEYSFIVVGDCSVTHAHTHLLKQLYIKYSCQ